MRNGMIDPHGKVCTGPCESCGRSDDKGRYVLDHNHQTGAVRGELCSNCNTALGMLNDNPVKINQLANYLATH
jgi:formate dehydrogenase maturation protein FdhE